MISVEELYVEFGGFELFKQVSFIQVPNWSCIAEVTPLK